MFGRLLIVEGEQFHCILGRNACIELGCLEILDNDALHKPETHSGNVFATQQVVTETHLLTQEVRFQLSN